MEVIDLTPYATSPQRPSFVPQEPSKMSEGVFQEVSPGVYKELSPAELAALLEGEENTSPEKTTLSGFQAGQHVRLECGLDFVDYLNEPVQIQISDSVTSFDTPFFCGMFGESIRNLGEIDFRINYQFICSPAFRNKIEAGIQLVLNDIEARSEIDFSQKTAKVPREHLGALIQAAFKELEKRGEKFDRAKMAEVLAELARPSVQRLPDIGEQFR